MKQLNGKLVVRVLIVAPFEFTQEEADRVIGAPTESAKSELINLLNARPPVETHLADFQMEAFKKAYGEALVDSRARELKMLSAPSTAAPAE